jgi:hypothetical protein
VNAMRRADHILVPLHRIEARQMDQERRGFRNTEVPVLGAIVRTRREAQQIDAVRDDDIFPDPAGLRQASAKIVRDDGRSRMQWRRAAASDAGHASSDATARCGSCRSVSGGRIAGRGARAQRSRVPSRYRHGRHAGAPPRRHARAAVSGSCRIPVGGAGSASAATRGRGPEWRCGTACRTTTTHGPRHHPCRRAPAAAPIAPGHRPQDRKADGPPGHRGSAWQCQPAAGAAA